MPASNPDPVAERCPKCSAERMKINDLEGKPMEWHGWACGSTNHDGRWFQSPRCRIRELEAQIKELKDLLTRLCGWDMMDSAADGPYWREQMLNLGIHHPDPARNVVFVSPIPQPPALSHTDHAEAD